MGLPRIKKILTDNGTEFVGKNLSTLCQRLNIRHETTAAYNPQKNGAIERIHSVIDQNIWM